MGTTEPLLNVTDRTYGPFHRWLEELGLRDFIQRYPVNKLVKWGWLVPQYTIRFPEEFFRTWPNYPSHPWGGADSDFKKHELHHILWDSDWYVDSEDEPLWFLHPFFRPNDEGAKALRQSLAEPYQEDDILALKGGRTIHPYAHYFYHWQAYALVDVVRFADLRLSLFNTPTLEREAASISRTVEAMKQIDPTDVLRIPQRWGKHSAPMTWLSHYRALTEALTAQRLKGDEGYEVHSRGARSLATHLGISAESLEAAIQDSLLVLASQWNWSGELRSKWILRAWHELQKDVLMAVQWLCILNGQTLDFYLDKWRYNHWGEADWKELRKVLPIESFRARDDFVELAPMYLEPYNNVVPTEKVLTKDSLPPLVDRLRSTNYPFGSLLHAFRELHEALTHRVEDFKKLDLRERRPLDYYLLMAIRVESVLRYALEEEGALSSMDERELGLRGYISRRAKARGVSDEAIEYFQQSERQYTRLQNIPPDPIASIMAMRSSLSAAEHYLVQAFLCSMLGRNYFAHHYYLDGTLLRSKESGFMLGGILITALVLA